MSKIDFHKHQSAKQVPITDSGDYFVGTEVETALQEIGAGTTLDTHYLKIDQTSEQTLVNGIPLLEASRTISDTHHLVDKEYVDVAVTSLGVRYYMTDDDDASGYKLCSLSAPSGGEESYVASSLTDDEYIMGWISATGEAPDKLLEGVYDFQITAEKTGGTKDLRVYWKLVERKSDDSEVVVATSSYSDLITNKAVFHPVIVLSGDYEPDSGSRIVGKLYASVTSGGSDPEITIYYNGNLDSHWEIPANNEIFQNIFVPYSGAVSNVDLGSYDLTTTGDITGNNLNISNWDAAYTHIGESGASHTYINQDVTTTGTPTFGVTTLGDGSKLASSAAPTNDADIANKKYVDDTAGGGGGATTALDNLASVAINTSLISDTDNTDDLGSAAKEWRNLYIDGTANIDSLVADTADINGGTLDGVAIGATCTQAEWDAAYTHVSSSGTDHTYIDQDVTTTGTPSFTSVDVGASVLATRSLTVDTGGVFNIGRRG